MQLCDPLSVARDAGEQKLQLELLLDVLGLVLVLDDDADVDPEVQTERQQPADLASLLVAARVDGEDLDLREDVDVVHDPVRHQQQSNRSDC